MADSRNLVLQLLITARDEASSVLGRARQSISIALDLIKKGLRVARKGWNGEDMFIFLVPGSRFEVSRPPLLGAYAAGTPINYHAHIDMRTADGYIVPWAASQTDLLADDWLIVEYAPFHKQQHGA